MWTKVALGQAKQHPLYGRGGSAAAFTVYLIGILIAYSAIIIKFTPPNQTPKVGGLVVLMLIFVIYRLIRGRPCKSLITILSIIILSFTALFCLLYAVDADPIAKPILFDASGTGLLFSVLVLLPSLVYAHKSRRFRVTYENEVRSNDPLLSRKAEQSGTSKTAGIGEAEYAAPKKKKAAFGARWLRCGNCKFMNRVSSYSFEKRPICGNCKQPLDEPIWIKAIRYCYSNPLFLMVCGFAVALVGFIFLDRYAPGYGFVWNVINGRVFGIGYRYVLSIALMVFLSGGYLYSKRQRH